VWAKCADELFRWFRETCVVRQIGFLRGRWSAGDGQRDCLPGAEPAGSSPGSFPPSQAAPASSEVAIAPSAPATTHSAEVGAQAGVPDGEDQRETPSCMDATVTARASEDAQQSCSQPIPCAADEASPSQSSRKSRVTQQPSRAADPPTTEVHKPGFPARAICRHVGVALQQLTQDLQVLLFLAFPRGSPYQDDAVEELFQWHYTRRWWLCLDWSTVALVLMLVWDVAMNPPYRMMLVLLFYSACGAWLLLRKVLLLAAPPPPRSRRIWHNVLLCLFFFGRCIVCQPLFVTIATEGSRPFRTLQVEAFSSIIGLGMTNLSLVFMQQLQTFDMLLFCLLNGAVFCLWIIFGLQMPFHDALHTAYVGSIVVTAVCVRQQRDLEDIERRTFEHDLLHARGMLVRSADRIAAQATPREFAMGMHILGRARRAEHLHF